MQNCPCCSEKTYFNCCLPFLSGQSNPETPEQLMRSRYTAYSQANIQYIKKTMRGKPLAGFNELEAKQWAEQVQWLGLEVLRSPAPQTGQGFVEFIAHFAENNQPKMLHELSEFQQIDGQWFYVDGINKQATATVTKTKIGRNEPCPCGSGKKFKHCHAR